jgi:hypothetical protein
MLVHSFTLFILVVGEFQKNVLRYLIGLSQLVLELEVQDQLDIDF